MWATLDPNWATYSTGRTFVQFFIMPECRTVRHWNKGTQVRYQNATVLDWNTGCRDTNAGGIGLNAMPSYANLQKKGDGWGCLISSQNTIRRLLISSPPSKRTVKQEKVIFLYISSFQDFRWIFHGNSCLLSCLLVGVFWEISLNF
jgi:hypothetical protein